MGGIRKMLDEQHRLRREMYRNHNQKQMQWIQQGIMPLLRTCTGDQPNKDDSHNTFKNADGQLTQSPDETLAAMEQHT